MRNVAAVLTLTLTTTLLTGTMPAGAATDVPGPAEQVTAEAVAPQITTTQLGTAPAPAGAAADSAASTPPDAAPTVVSSGTIEVDRFTLAAVTWDGATPVTEDDVDVTVRVREDSGWSAWEELSVTDAGPDTTVAAAQGLRSGTDPLFTGGADAIEVEVTTDTGVLPRDLQVTTIDAGERAQDEQLPAYDEEATGGAVAGGDALASADADAVATVAPRPTIISRAGWGADESMRRDGLGYNSTVKSVVIHHTAGANGYTSAGSAAEVRGIYAYHAITLGWGDIGYHFLVDKYGRIYEGRYGSLHGSLSRPPKGAHAGGNNVDTMGVSAMGNYDVVAAPQVMVNAMAAVTGWKLSQYGVDPAGTVTQAVGGTRGSSIQPRRVVTLPAVNAHKDTYLTACPGRYLFPKMAEIRSRAAAHARSGGGDPAPSEPAPKTGRALFDAYSQVLIRAGSTGIAVRDLEAELHRRGYNAGTVDRTWTSSTTAAVRAFQGRAMLPLDDAVGWSDWTALAGLSYTQVTPLSGQAMLDQYGRTYLNSSSFGESVRAVQAALTVKGYDAGPPTGTWTTKTSGALTAFQRHKGLTVDANMQTADWRALAAQAQRIAGNDRYDTAAELAAGYPAGVSTVYVASGAKFPDAISAAVLAARSGSPVLLTRPDVLPPDVRVELTRLRPGRIVVVGGPASVSGDVATALKKYTTGKVTRLAGPDRYTTAAKASATYPVGVPVAYVAKGTDYPDALAGAALAGKDGGPVLLTKPGALPPDVRTELSRLKPRRIVILGGTDSVSPDVARALDRYTTGSVTRIGGADRYEASANIAAAYKAGVAKVYVASGEVFPDALAASAAAGKAGVPVLLTRSGSVPDAAERQLRRLAPRDVLVLGGSATITETVLGRLGAFVN